MGTTESLRQVVSFDNPIFTKSLTQLFAALLWFDCALTFPMEVRHFWKCKISGAMLVYIVIRYTAIIDRVFLISEGLLRSSGFLVSTMFGGHSFCAGSSQFPRSYKTCDAVQRVDDVILTLNHLAFSGAFLSSPSKECSNRSLAFTILGVYGFCGPNWKLLSVVVPLALFKPASYIVNMFIRSHLCDYAL